MMVDIFPTMITPYKTDGSIDYDMARKFKIVSSEHVSHTYKRLVTPKIRDFCLETGRFYYI